jgi:hypothetical protein
MVKRAAAHPEYYKLSEKDYRPYKPSSMRNNCAWKLSPDRKTQITEIILTAKKNSSVVSHQKSIQLTDV